MTVYPRVGGGNPALSKPMMWRRGLSPRGRGKRTRRSSLNTPRRSIPAWAGETFRAGSSYAQGRVYPRVGGGNLHACRRASRMRGLSPRGRGKRQNNDGATPIARSIPAWAGETM